MVTPYIRTIRLEGGTFYSFQSASNHITDTFNSSNRQFRFSKFALLNLPDIKTPTNGINTIQFNTIDGAIFNNDFSDLNNSMAESFQNYALNLESTLMNQPTYDGTSLKTSSERVFFKWLKELGAIRFKDAPNTVNATTSFRAMEEDEVLQGNAQYSKVVKYVGNIDMTNNISKQGNSYSEVYIYVPNSHGNTPQIMFESKSDNNYSNGMILTGTNDVIEGRENTDVHPANLSINAFYDYDNPITYTDSVNADWHGQTVPNSYFTENVFANTGNDLITKVATDYGLTFSDVQYKRSKLDGIGIDFDAQSYLRIYLDSTLNDLSQTNALDDSNNFEFNCVLVYYDINDTTDVTNRATNLFGVLFLDNIKPISANGGNIPRFAKYKQNPVTKLNGNSYGLTLNFKFDVSVEESGVTTTINDYNTYSMELFSESLIRLKDITKSFTTESTRLTAIEAQINQLQTELYTSESYEMLKLRIDDLETTLINANLAIDNAQAIFDLIEQLNNRINEMLAGTVPINLVYTFENILNGDGIQFQKFNNKLLISSPIQDMNTFKEISIDPSIDNANDVKLDKFGNYIRIMNGATMLDMLMIRIDDSAIRFKTGQKLRIVFSQDIDFNSFPLVIYTDFNGKFGNGDYGKLICAFNSYDLSKRPILEIHCTNENTYSFYADLIR